MNNLPESIIHDIYINLTNISFLIKQLQRKMRAYICLAKYLAYHGSLHQ